MIKTFLVERWFLLTLGVVLVAGLFFPNSLEAAAGAVPQNLVIGTVLFLMALPLELRSMGQALLRPKATLLAVAINSGLLPLAAWGAAQFLSDDVGPGVLIAASVPCTLASAAVWTRKAGGNDAVAILVMVITNLTCFVVTPFWLVLTTSKSIQSERLSFGAMAANLALVVVAPMVLGQLCRLYKPLAAWATRRKIGLSVVAQCGILCTVFVGAVHSGLRLNATSGPALSGWDWGAMLVAVVGLHVAALSIGLYLSGLAGLSHGDRIAVGFAGSQKTLMAGLHLSSEHFGPLAMLPMVAYHVCQLVFDTLVADHFARQKTAPPASDTSDEAAEPGDSSL